MVQVPFGSSPHERIGLLDISSADALSEKERPQRETDGETKISDLHLWRVAPGSYAAIISLVTKEHRMPCYYKDRLKGIRLLRHVTVEIHPCSQDC